MSDINPVTIKLKRPTSFTVFGVITVVLCGLGLLGALWSFVWLGLVNSFQGNFSHMQSAADSQLLMESFQSLIGLFIPYLIIATIVGVISHGLGLTGGIGLLSDKKWGRVLAGIYAVATIIIMAGSLIFILILIDKLEPILQKAFAQTGDVRGWRGKSDFDSTRFMTFIFPIYKVLAIIGEIAGCVFPVLLLVFTHTQKANAFVKTLSR